MLQRILFFLPSIISVLPIAAQERPPEEQEVLAVIDRFFGYMAARDSAGMASTMEMEGMFTAVEIGPGTSGLRTFTHAAYLSGLKKGRGELLERYWDPTVRMDPGVAMVSCPYDFHVDGAFSHCGLDVFTLVKRDGLWRIAGAVFSRQANGCPDSPLGPIRK